MTAPTEPSTPALADLIATVAHGIVSVTSRSRRASGFVSRDDLIGADRIGQRLAMTGIRNGRIDQLKVVPSERFPR